jgi:hypothetical protein
MHYNVYPYIRIKCYILSLYFCLYICTMYISVHRMKLTGWQGWQKKNIAEGHRTMGLALKNTVHWGSGSRTWTQDISEREREREREREKYRGY